MSKCKHRASDRSSGILSSTSQPITNSSKPTIKLYTKSPYKPLAQEGFSFSTPDWDVVCLTYVTVAAREKDKKKQSHVGHTLATRRSVKSLHCKNDLAVCRAHRGLPVGFLLLRYSV